MSEGLPTAYERDVAHVRVGTHLVDRAMTASGASAADLVLVPTEEILRRAGAR